jgi:integrase
MTFRVKKRGRTYRLEGRAGEIVNVRGRRGAGERERIRLSLGTANGDAAHMLHGRIERAIAEGPASGLWSNLRTVLPAETFARLAAVAGHIPESSAGAPRCTWDVLLAKFKGWMSQRIALDKLRESTRERYLQSCAAFGDFLAERGIADLAEVRRATIEDFKAWQVERIRARKHSRGGRGVVLDAAILHGVFRFAVDCELMAANPVRMEGRPGDRAEHGSQPLTGEQLGKLRGAAGADLVAFLLLRHTGLRGSDAVRLTFAEIDWENHEINRLTLKRRKRVLLQIHPELFFALEVERDRRQPKPEERILLNPEAGRQFTRPALYRRMMALGRRAGIPNANPHRYRDTLAVDLLCKGASPYDVAKFLGDTIETIERHYAPYVLELRDRVRRILESSGGLEVAGTPRAQEKPTEGKPN